MKILYTTLLIFIVFSLGACLDDKTNLNYTEPLLPDSVFVTNLNTGVRVRYQTGLSVPYSVKPGEELQLDAEVFYRGDDEITYEWRFEKEVISTEKKLRYTFIESDNSCMLLVFRKNAGNAVCYQFQVKLREPFSTGVVVLAKNQGVTKLDFVERYYEKKVPVDFGGSKYSITLYQYVEYKDVYATFNKGTQLEGKEPIKLFRYGGFNYNETPLRGLQILDKDWRNSVTVNVDKMTKIASMRDEFVVEPQNLQPVDFINVGAMNLLLDKSGKIYTRVNYDFGNPCTGKYTSLPMTFDDPNDVPDKGPVEIKADCFFNNSTSYAFIYEKEKKRFLAMTAVRNLDQNLDYYYVTDFSKPVNINNLPKGYVDLNNFDKELISVIVTSEYEDNYFLFKDGNDYYIQPCGLNLQTYSMPYQIMITAKASVKLSPEIAQLLAVGENRFYPQKDEKYNPVLYFSSGNAIYLTDYSGNMLKKIFEFPQKDKITHFAIMMPWHVGSASAVNRYYNGRVFCAAFDNGDFKVVKMYDDPEKPGEVQYSYWVDNHYDGGVADVYYYQN